MHAGRPDTGDALRVRQRIEELRTGQRGLLCPAGCGTAWRNRMRYPPIKKGQVFERLTVLSRAEKQGGMRMWLCQCSCGVERAIRDAHLKKGITKSCGCLSRDVQVGKAKERAGSVIGRKINQWDVLSLSPRRAKQGGVYFNCRCVCGQEREVAGDGLLAGRSKSCGSCTGSKQH